MFCQKKKKARGAALHLLNDGCSPLFTFSSAGPDDGAIHSFIEKVKSGTPALSVETVTKASLFLSTHALLSWRGEDEGLVTFSMMNTFRSSLSQ